MKKKFSYKILILAAVMALAFVLVACNPSTVKTKEVTDVMETEEDTMESEATDEMADETSQESMAQDDSMTEESTMDETTNEVEGDKVFTLQELSQFDGTDGNPAYVAVDGVVYDVTDVPKWSEGTHNGNTAGQDLTEAINSAPHGTSKLDDLPVVGTLSDKMSDTMEEEKVFTLEELAQFDGTDGNPAYVAVNGVVYDVTDKGLWAGGTHKGNTAGQDLTEAIKDSPHGKSKLEDLPVVGTLAEE